MKLENIGNSNIVLSRGTGILKIQISRREKGNSLTCDMYLALSGIFAFARESSGVRVVMIHGQGDLFTVGDDVDDFLDSQADFLKARTQFLRILATFEKPVIAAVAGMASGIGAAMLLHCDFVYAADNARFQYPFVSLALCPDGGSSALLPRIGGHRKALELLLLGEPFDAKAALAAGMINSILPLSLLMEDAMGIAEKLAAQPLQAVLLTKSLIRASSVDRILDVMQMENIHYSELAAGPSARQRVAELRSRDWASI